MLCCTRYIGIPMYYCAEIGMFHQPSTIITTECYKILFHVTPNTHTCKNTSLMYTHPHIHVHLHTYTLPFNLSTQQEQAASTIVYCAAHPSMDTVSGLYMYNCWPVQPSPEAQDPSTSAALWELSEQIVAEKMSQL